MRATENVFNDWHAEKVIHADRITQWDFLRANECIEEIADGYYFLSKPLETVEAAYYRQENAKLTKMLGIKNVEQELKVLIGKFNTYNAAKDVVEELCGKLASLRGVPIRDIHKELNLTFDG
ncbi:hypothetical protein PAPHI01_1522 [Pancytospora philotis]|nr:hypothetical protein PAPHI01_1522 [Pancytospora philotis]